MKDRASDYNDQTEKPDFFDPFWMLFTAEEEEEDISEATGTKNTGARETYVDEEGGGMFDYRYFMAEPEDTSLDGESLARFERSEEREPSQQSKRSQRQSRHKKQHHWRRGQPKKEKERRLGFGRRNSSKRNSTSSNYSMGSRIPNEQRDMHDESVASAQITADSFVYHNEKVFPSFMDAFSTRWGPWGEEDFSSESSVASYDVSYESSRQDDSVASASYASRSMGPKERQEVQQILVQFNPGADPKEGKAEIPSVRNRRSENLKRSTPKASMDNNPVILPVETSPAATFFGNDESTISSYEKTERTDIFNPEIEFDIQSEGESHKKCLSLSKICGLAKRKERWARFSYGRSKSSSGGGLVDQKDLPDVFPKLRMVADEKDPGARTSAVVANSKKFKGNIPAHLQLSSEAFLATNGPQSLYEYEYDGSEHIDVVYNHFGSNPLSLIVIRHHLTPPRLRRLGAIVQVEASTISKTDCSMRSGEWMGKDTPPLPITPGVDMVGKIFRIDSEVSEMLDLCLGDRVISLTRCGGNSRFLALDPWQLVKISEEVDPAEAACLAETYMSAFQVIHFGQGAGLRYKSNALRGKSILLLGSVAATLGHAIVELASVAGASRIIATSTPKHFPQLRSLGIIPVSVDPALWYDQLNEEIDLVLVTDANAEVLAEHFKVLNDRGHLIVIGQRMGSGMPIGDWENEFNTKTLICKRQKAKASMIDRTHDYNPFRQWESDLEKCKRDLSFLVKLLERGDIKPNVLDRIPLNKVAKAQDMVESQRHPGGFLVCEPWLRNKKRAVRL